MRTIGIAAHSFEGGALCFLTACREGGAKLGPHMHPEIVLSAVPMALSLPSWESSDHETVGRHLALGVKRVADAGADFFICPDNTAHLVLERIAETLPIPGLHIADVVCGEIEARGWRRVGLLGTKWTMTGSVYEQALARRGMQRMLPDETFRAEINAAIFDELCQGIFKNHTIQMFVDAIGQLEAQGAECVILGCTEIPLIINAQNSPLPVLDTTRLLAKYAVAEALREESSPVRGGWLQVSVSASQSHGTTAG